MKRLSAGMKTYTWNYIEDVLIDSKIEEVYERDFRGARVYITKDVVYKIQLKEESYKSASFYQDLLSELAVLKSLQAQKGIVKILDYIINDDYIVLKLKRINGTNLAHYKFHSFIKFLACIISIFNMSVCLSFKRILHGDLAIHNFMIDSNGKLHLLDFGRAQGVSFFKAILGNTILKFDKDDFPVSGALVRIVEFYLPSKYQAYYRRLLGLKKYTDNLQLCESNLK